MTRTVTASEAGIHFGELLQEVSAAGATIVVEEAGEPVAVVLPAAEYEKLQEFRIPAWNKALELARRSRERIRKELGDRPLPPPEEMIRAGREERDEQLTGLP